MVLLKDLILYFVMGVWMSCLELFSFWVVVFVDSSRNLNERFECMKVMILDCLMLGKLYIYGYGLFVKCVYVWGEMIIDYVGEIVCLVVVDIRERDVYDICFGNGTYIFVLGGDD